MVGRLYIDGKDSYTTYGIYVQMGGWNELVSMPPLKAIPQNDWQEEDGIEVDLSEPVLDSREVAVRFAVRDIGNQYHDFIQLLSDGAYHTFDCRHISRYYRLRLVGVGSFTVNGNLGDVVLKFADDFPLDGYTYSPPISNLLPDVSFAIDEVPFSDYGIRILGGTLSEIIRTADVKQNLYKNIKSQKGAIYDPKSVVYKSKDVRITCLMIADTINGLWHNYDALNNDLAKAGERILWVGSLVRSFSCFYKSCQVIEFFPDQGKAWIKFVLTLTFIRDFRISIKDKLHEN